MDSTVLSLEGAVEPAVLAFGIGVLMKFSVGSVEVPVGSPMLLIEFLVKTLVPPVIVPMAKNCRSANQQPCERKGSNKSFWQISFHNDLLKRDSQSLGITRERSFGLGMSDEESVQRVKVATFFLRSSLGVIQNHTF